jgi:hypothetical protein
MACFAGLAGGNSPATPFQIAALERISPACDMVQFIVFVGMNDAGKELTHIYDSHDNHWHRRCDETQVEFNARAMSETPRTKERIATLFAKSFKVPNA